MEPSVAGNSVTGNFSINANLPNGKTFSVSGYLYDGESVESVNARVDILHDVVDRQRTRAEIPELETKRDQMIKQLDQMREHMAGIAKRKGEGAKLSSQEKLALDNLNASIEKAQAEIVKGTEAIAQAKLTTGMK